MHTHPDLITCRAVSAVGDHHIHAPVATRSRASGKPPKALAHQHRGAGARDPRSRGSRCWLESRGPLPNLPLPARPASRGGHRCSCRASRLATATHHSTAVPPNRTKTANQPVRAPRAEATPTQRAHTSQPDPSRKRPNESAATSQGLPGRVARPAPNRPTRRLANRCRCRAAQSSSSPAPAQIQVQVPVAPRSSRPLAPTPASTGNPQQARAGRAKPAEQGRGGARGAAQAAAGRAMQAAGRRPGASPTAPHPPPLPHPLPLPPPPHLTPCRRSVRLQP